MNQDSVEHRRLTVYRLLTECFDQKLLRGGSATAICKANQAYELARRPTLLPAPWPQLAAYRLAHLKMRAADLTVPMLREIDKYFSEASEDCGLCPLPPIYRLAALARLESALPEGAEKRDVRSRCEATIGDALCAIRRTHFSIEPVRGRDVQPPPVQTAAFNLLELASYFLGVPYSKLEGIAGVDELNPLRNGRWFITGRGIETILLTESLARSEFEARAKSAEYVLIELDEHGAKWGLSSRSGHNLKQVNPEFAKLILYAVAARSGSDLRRRTVGTDGANPSGRFRQVKLRTRRALAELVDRQDLELFAGEELTDELQFLGLVHSPALR